MKIYEKPRLVALSLSGNDILCAGCAIDAEEPNMDADLAATIKDMIAFGFAEDAIFAGDMDTCTSPITGYCKFGPTGTLVFSS